MLVPFFFVFGFSGVCCAVKKLFKKANQILVLDGIGRIATALRLLQMDPPYFQCTKIKASCAFKMRYFSSLLKWEDVPWLLQLNRVHSKSSNNVNGHMSFADEQRSKLLI